MTLVDRVTRRLKLRDLQFLQAVVQWGSMAKAAAHLNLTQPAVSKAIGELEHTLGVRLLERSRHGIEPTMHGEALLRRGAAIFDELRQGVSEIEHLSDPATGEVRVAASIPMAAGILPVVVSRLSRRYPRLTIHAREIALGSLQFHMRPYVELRERTVDLVIGPIVPHPSADDLQIEPLFGDPAFVVTSSRNPWLRRHTIALGDLVDELWCLPPPDSAAGLRCVEAFRTNGLSMPQRNVTSVSISLQLGLLATGRFFTILPGSLMRFSASRLAIRRVRVKLAVPPLPIGIVTLKSRTISPAAQLFIQAIREVAKPLADA